MSGMGLENTVND